MDVCAVGESKGTITPTQERRPTAQRGVSRLLFLLRRDVAANGERLVGNRMERWRRLAWRAWRAARDFGERCDCFRGLDSASGAVHTLHPSSLQASVRERKGLEKGAQMQEVRGRGGENEMIPADMIPTHKHGAESLNQCDEMEVFKFYS